MIEFEITFTGLYRSLIRTSRSSQYHDRLI